ncbi:sporulation protein YpjB [Bacillus sp. FJAT-27225]|uniref:sporulation protein YpjB n=1 Tax=Bacillus sp. FJAT-27225 TaxID=1743144 RepID=UPI00080C3232|nr:sporulation protein YpjB [Bacillus sp. FJAT-27225]OCA90916.1 sporulation protein YpjB [Bacillus sp. FJAT-27225]
MKIRCFLISLFLISFPLSVFAAENLADVEKLDEISDDAFQMVKNQRYEDAQKLLSYFSEEFEQMYDGTVPITLDEMRIVSVSRDEAMEAAASPTMEYQERLNKVTRFRLVIDALSTSSDPLWSEMEDDVMGAFSQAKQAAQKGEPTLYHANLNSFLSMYELIYPSMKIDVPKEQLQRVDARVRSMEKLSSSLPKSQAELEELDALGTSLQDIFNGIEEDEADPSLWWVIISTGSIIILTLSYVGWRKYKGDREIAKKRRELKD